MALTRKKFKFWKPTLFQSWDEAKMPYMEYFEERKLNIYIFLFYNRKILVELAILSILYDANYAHFNI